MYEKDGEKRELTIAEVIGFLMIGLLLNAIGNGLTVATNMGSAPWTAAAANLSNVTTLPIDVFLFSFGLFAALAVVIILRHFDAGRFFRNLAFVFIFSVVIGATARGFKTIGVGELNYWLRLLLDIFGITMIGMGISVTQRLAKFIHPLDDLTNVTRFKYFHGNVVVAQTLNFAIPMTISLVVWLVTGKLVAINIGTFFSFFCQGMVISRADHFLIPHLKHRSSL
ncbi:putative membrane protein YczE [Weissella uvarum]|uniref:hypothetical protein n=1 Tax=Weissella uvarum TaxID=1479233 RepID=UPI0019618044|nr:hypothetical protein [Weissella uvarum]MBM7616939.1 putative membrane protein YczE [Weissella uvarum]MCM0594612.1 hypothetical protein [Weissella uvarum]